MVLMDFHDYIIKFRNIMIPYRKQFKKFKKFSPGFISSIQSFIQDGVNKTKNNLKKKNNKISDSINIHTIFNITSEMLIYNVVIKLFIHQLIVFFVRLREELFQSFFKKIFKEPTNFYYRKY